MRARIAASALILTFALSALSAESGAGPAPVAGENLSFEHLESLGAVVGKIVIDTQNIFDLSDEKENNVFFGAANTAHIHTRPEVIRKKLLFKPGDRVSKRVIEESERLLLSYRFLYEARIRAVAFHEGIADIEVKTRDTWTLQPGASASRSGGTNRRGLTLIDTNIAGTGMVAGIKRISDADRTSTVYQVTQPHAFDGWTTIDYSLAQLSDGLTRSASVLHPFYALDTRWAYGLSASDDTRVNHVFGTNASAYRHWRDAGEIFAGHSRGLVEGWAHRYSIGMTYLKDRYDVEPGFSPPADLPPDQTLVAPFLRYEAVEDDYDQLKNRDLIERPEFFAMGTQSKLQLGRSFVPLGSTQDLWLYSASLSDGVRLTRARSLLLSGSVDGQAGFGPLNRQAWNGALRYYGNPRGDRLFFWSLTGSALRDATDASTQLLLGGDTGLRGYPRNYQSGDRLLLYNVEERIYTDWYPFRLFRVGGAAFYDFGRAWGGQSQGTGNGGWLSDAGFGLRILSARSSFGNVMHIDVAFPLNRDPAIKSVQFLVSTKVTL